MAISQSNPGNGESDLSDGELEIRPYLWVDVVNELQIQSILSGRLARLIISKPSKRQLSKDLRLLM